MNRETSATQAGSGTFWIDRSDRVRIKVSGPDRAKFLHNLTTQEIKRLPTGEGREAFVTSLQGKTIGYVTVLAGADEILIRTDVGGSSLILPHLRKYGVFDDVEIEDVTASTFELHVAGPGCPAVFRAMGVDGVPEGDLRHVEVEVSGVPVTMTAESPAGVPGVSLIGPKAGVVRVIDGLRVGGAGLGLRSLSRDDFEWMRIEAGTPEAGRDVTPDNLPQEVGRDARTINFVKGCYLGQETVARLDALGHVNKLLRGVTLTGETPPPDGSALEAAGKAVGRITSAAFSPGRGGVVALGYVRTTHAGPGTVVDVRDAEGSLRRGVVAGLPFGEGPRSTGEASRPA